MVPLPLLCFYDTGAIRWLQWHQKYDQISRTGIWCDDDCWCHILRIWQRIILYRVCGFILKPFSHMVFAMLVSDDGFIVYDATSTTRLVALRSGLLTLLCVVILHIFWQCTGLHHWEKQHWTSFTFTAHELTKHWEYSLSQFFLRDDQKAAASLLNACANLFVISGTGNGSVDTTSALARSILYDFSPMWTLFWVFRCTELLVSDWVVS